MAGTQKVSVSSIVSVLAATVAVLLSTGDVFAQDCEDTSAHLNCGFFTELCDNDNITENPYYSYMSTFCKQTCGLCPSFAEQPGGDAGGSDMGKKSMGKKGASDDDDDEAEAKLGEDTSGKSGKKSMGKKHKTASLSVSSGRDMQSGTSSGSFGLIVFMMGTVVVTVGVVGMKLRNRNIQDPFDGTVVVSENTPLTEEPLME